MSEPSCLFPAYASKKENNTDTESNVDWLKNSSFTSKIPLEKFCPPPDNVTDDNLIESQDSKRQKIFNEVDASHPKRNQVSTFERRESSFYLDKKYDPQNFALGSLDFKTIPKYIHNTSVPFGVPKEKVCNWSSNVKRSKRLIRYFSKSSKKKKQQKFVIEKILPSQKDVEGLPEYLPFNIHSKVPIVKATSMSSFDGISSTWKDQFNSSVKDLYSVKENDNVCDLLDEETMEKICKFNRSLIDSPYDEDLWLEFVAFQRESFPYSRDNTEVVMCDKQISILDRALKHNPNSVRLNVTKLELLRNSQSREEHMSSWDNMIFYHPNDVFAWCHYLKFVLTDIAFFNVSRITKLFVKCLKMLSNIQEGKMTSHLPSPTFVQDMIGIFFSICKVFHGLGYRELALGAFQAQIEFNLFPPPEVTELDDRISLFEPFWDSGVPRFGENDAIGWSNTVKGKVFKANVAASVIETNNLEDGILSQKLPEWSTWLEFEKLRQKNYWLPWRLDPDSEQESEDVDDADRIISFEQISGFLFKITEEKLKFLLLCDFFTFLGLQLHDMNCPLLFMKNDLATSRSFDKIYSCIKDIFPNGKIPATLNFSSATELNFSQEFLENVYRQSNCIFSDEYKRLISLIWLRYQINNVATVLNNKKAISNLKKSAKALLKKVENRNCLFLWSEYIHIEWLANNKVEANQMFESLLTSSTIQYTCNNFSSLWYFVRDYIDLFTGIKSLNEDTCPENYDKVLWILSHIGRKVQYVSYDRVKMKSYTTVLMKSQNSFKTIVTEELSKLNHNSEFCCCVDPYAHPVLDCIKCAVYFIYFFQNIESAMEFFRFIFHVLQDKMEEDPLVQFDYLEEQLTVFQAELHNFHCWRKNVPITALQTSLAESIEKYPGNVKLLYLLLKIKSCAKLIGPTRRFFYKLVKSRKDLPSVTWLFAIIAELMICLSVSDSLLCSVNVPESEEEIYKISNCGIAWRIRSLFASATKSCLSKTCIALWRTYIKFEMVSGETERAKSVFHQALQNCPWFKELYLDGIEYFPEDLRYLLDTMNEKQIRIHTPLEEISLLMEHACKDDDDEG